MELNKSVPERTSESKQLIHYFSTQRCALSNFKVKALLKRLLSGTVVQMLALLSEIETLISDNTTSVRLLGV